MSHNPFHLTNGPWYASQEERRRAQELAERDRQKRERRQELQDAPNAWQSIRGLLEPETGAGTAGLIGASVLPGVGEAIDVADLAAGFQDRDLGRMGWAAGGLLLPAVAGSTLRKIVQRGADKLPVDEASRLARRDEWVEPSAVKDQVYHGTTHVIDEFDPKMGQVESHHGKSMYFSTSPDDVARNYASVSGPDVKHHYQAKVEEIMNRDDLAYGNPAHEAQAAAEAEALVFGPHQGATIPAHLRLKNPVDTREGGTFFEWNEEYLRDLDEWTEAEGPLVDLMESVTQVAWEFGVDADLIANAVYEHAIDHGGISAQDFERILRSGDVAQSSGLYDAIDMFMDEPVGGPGEFLRRVYMDAGYDGTIVDAMEQFGPSATRGGMKGVEDAIHYAVFEPKNIRSPFALFDPSQMESGHLSAGLAGLLGTGMVRAQNRENYVER